MSNFIELTREDGYSTSVSAEDGASRCTFQLQGVDENTAPTVDEIAEFGYFLIGGVQNIAPLEVDTTDISGGKIKRDLPKTHPYVRELSVSGVSSIVGVGRGEAADSVQIFGIDPIKEQFWHYQRYNFVTEFKRRPYFLVPDDLIGRPERTYTKPDNTALDIVVAREYDRYTTTSLTPTPETVNATTGGQMRFRSTGPINGAQYPGVTWMYMQNQVLEMNWFLVPYRYFFTNDGHKPYLTRFLNTVNQHAMFGNDPGTMLFLGATPIPFQPQTTGDIVVGGLPLFQAQDLLCNIKLRWLVTSREAPPGDVPVAPDAGLANANNVASGHNLLPNFVDRQFHYVTTEDPLDRTNMTKWRASFPSFPHELFFTDPMLIQPGGPI